MVAEHERVQAEHERVQSAYERQQADQVRRMQEEHERLEAEHQKLLDELAEARRHEPARNESGKSGMDDVRGHIAAAIREIEGQWRELSQSGASKEILDQLKKRIEDLRTKAMSMGRPDAAVAVPHRPRTEDIQP